MCRLLQTWVPSPFPWWSKSILVTLLHCQGLKCWAGFCGWCHWCGSTLQTNKRRGLSGIARRRSSKVKFVKWDSGGGVDIQTTLVTFSESLNSDTTCSFPRRMDGLELSHHHIHSFHDVCPWSRIHDHGWLTGCGSPVHLLCHVSMSSPLHRSSPCRVLQHQEQTKLCWLPEKSKHVFP